MGRRWIIKKVIKFLKLDLPIGVWNMTFKYLSLSLSLSLLFFVLVFSTCTVSSDLQAYIYRWFATRMTQYSIWHFWAVDIEVMWRCNFDSYGVMVLVTKLNARRQLCRLHTPNKILIIMVLQPNSSLASLSYLLKSCHSFN